MHQDSNQTALRIINEVFNSAQDGSLSEALFSVTHKALLNAGNLALAKELATLWHLNNKSALAFPFSAQHFQRIQDPETARMLFSRSVKRVYVEISSFCNRRCSYCPNAFIDRISARKFLPDQTLEKIFRELGSIAYRGGLFFNDYNEPLADPNLCDKMALFKHYCPKALMLIYTNGDYLNRDYLYRLHGAGLDYLSISLHCKAEWNDAEVSQLLDALGKRLGMTPKVDGLSPGHQLVASFPEIPMEHRVFVSNYHVVGSNRGQLMPHIGGATYPDMPCQLPFNDLYIGWDGSILPCCHLHPDAPEHQRHKVGQLDDFADLFAAYADSPLVEWRRALIAPTRRQPPCDSCIEHVRDPEQVARMRALAQEGMGSA
ncbi:MAG: radical SAM protein [Magnetococcales bacterium]|nr:radical SAM protein [Magnetococcales bacterium]